VPICPTRGGGESTGGPGSRLGLVRTTVKKIAKRGPPEL
jgi:hypothetical protein